MTISNGNLSRGNRSTGTLGDYLLAIGQGRTLKEIGHQYGVTPTAVNQALNRHGLPTCALEYLRWLHKRESSALEFGKDATA